MKSIRSFSAVSRSLLALKGRSVMNPASNLFGSGGIAEQIKALTDL
jgi:hypothetical protein